MEYGIIADSCCDLTPEMRQQLGAVSVPLTMRVSGVEYVDDDGLDVNDFLQQMANCREKMGSAAPAPFLYQQEMVKAVRSFVVTLSSQLSGSYASAMAARSSALLEGAEEVHVFDSKSASAAEILIVMKIRELIQQGLPSEKIISTVTGFIDNMKTYFVLENYDNLLKNGRLGRITEKLIRVLNIRLVMGADGTGNIALYGKARGARAVVEKMTSLVEASGRHFEGERLVITHCNNPELATQLRDAIAPRCNFSEIHIIHTRGLSSLYADNKGVIMAF